MKRKSTSVKRKQRGDDVPSDSPDHDSENSAESDDDQVEKKRKSRITKRSPKNLNDDDSDQVNSNKRKQRKSDVPSDSSEDDHGSTAESDNDQVEKKRKNKKSKRSSKNYNDDDSDQSENSPKKRGKLQKFKGKYLSQKSAEENGEKTKMAKENDEEYEVEKIVSEKIEDDTLYYKIRWKGYGPKSDTWEPENTLNCAEAIEKYKKKKKNSKKPAESEEWDENENFEVDRIKDVYFHKNGKREFLVSWKGFSKKYDSWEPEENMSCKELIEKFLRKCDEAREATQKELRVNRKTTDRFTLTSQDHGRRLSKRYLGKQRVQYQETD